MGDNDVNKKKVKPLPTLTEKHERPTYKSKNFSRDSERRAELSEKEIVEKLNGQTDD